MTNKTNETQSYETIKHSLEGALYKRVTIQTSIKRVRSGNFGMSTVAENNENLEYTNYYFLDFHLIPGNIDSRKQ